MNPKKKANHPTEKIWDAAVSIAVDGSMKGRISVYASGHVGSMRFNTADGRRFRLTLEHMETEPEEGRDG